jgi:hypothetical protein
MEDVEQQHAYEHKRRIEDVQPELLRLERSAVALDVLDGAEDGTHEDETRGGVEDVEEALPGRAGHGGGVADRAVVKEAGDDDEDSEADELDEEAANDDVLGTLELVGRVG